MSWLWFVAPMTVALVALLISLSLTREEKQLREALRRWLAELAGPLRSGKKTRSRGVKRLHPTFANMLDLGGGGARIGDAVLLPKQAYLAARGASSSSGAQHVTVVAKLARRAPDLVARPLPIYDGAPAENTGIRFSKDPAFMDEFVVEGEQAKAIGKWLSGDIRDALMDMPDVWLRTQGSYATITLYGNASADDIDELVSVADSIYAEHGHQPDLSLLGLQDEEEPLSGYRSGKKKKKARAARVVEAKAAASTPASAQLRLSCAAVDVGLYLLGMLFLVMVMGGISRFHPAALFNSPDQVVNEPWQGGWTTKGFGALVAAQSFLLGLLTLQSYLLSKYGQTIGKVLFGAKVVNADGGLPSFTRVVVLRQWIWVLPPLVVAAVRAQPLSARAFFEQLPTLPVIAVAGGLVVVAVASAVAGASRGLHDRVAGTEVVSAPSYQLVSLQLGERSEPDPVISRRLQTVGALFAVMAGLSVAYLMGVSFWIF